MKAFSFSLSHLAVGGTRYSRQQCAHFIANGALTVWKQKLDGDTEYYSYQTLGEKQPLPTREPPRARDRIKGKGKNASDDTGKVAENV